MNYNEFLVKAAAAVKTEMPDMKVEITPVEKLQGGSYFGISVKPEDSLASVTLRAEDVFERLSPDEGNLSELLNEVVSKAKDMTANIPDFNVARLSDYEYVKDHLSMQMVSRPENEAMLQKLPHKVNGDIVLVYRIVMEESNQGRASTLVTDHLLNVLGITKERLHEDALTSQLKMDPPTLRSISDVLGRGAGAALESSPLWVATVESGINGACVVEMPDFLNKASMILGGDYFVLPSSTQEVLFLPDNGSFKREQLEEMVAGVNQTVVRKEDFLSNNVYHYDCKERIFEQALSFESRVAEQTVSYDVRPKETIHVLLVEPEKYPRPVEIGAELKDLQKAVGGFIEVSYPFIDNVGLIMNDEGKIQGLPLNRALRDDNGEIYDVVAGPFLVAGLTEDNFGSLTPEQMEKYSEHFHSPEVFLKMGKGIMALPMPDEAVELKNKKGPELKPEKVIGEAR